MIASSASRVLVRSAVALWSASAALAVLLMWASASLPPPARPVGIVAAFLAALLPFVATAGLRRPLVTIYALWAALVPFDNILQIPGLLTLGKIVGAVAALLAVLNVLAAGRAIRPAPAVLCWTGLVGWAALSLAWAYDPQPGIVMAIQLAGLLAVGVAIAVVAADRVDLTGVALGISTGGVIASVYGVVTFLGSGSRMFFGNGQIKGGGIDPNHFAAALLAPALCCAVAAVSHARSFVRFAALGATAICAAGILVTESRAALVAFGIGLLYVAIRSAHRIRLLPLFVLAALLLAAFPGVIERFSDPTVAHGGGRFDIWRVALSSFEQHWAFGWGLGMFQPALLQGYLDVFVPSDYARLNNSHNIVVGTAVELGIVGLALMLLAWWSQLRCAAEIAASGGWGAVRVAAEAITISLFVVALSLDLLTFKYTWLALSAVWIARSAYLGEVRR